MRDSRWRCAPSSQSMGSRRDARPTPGLRMEHPPCGEVSRPIWIGRCRCDHRRTGMESTISGRPCHDDRRLIFGPRHGTDSRTLNAVDARIDFPATVPRPDEATEKVAPWTLDGNACQSNLKAHYGFSQGFFPKPAGFSHCVECASRNLPGFCPEDKLCAKKLGEFNSVLSMVLMSCHP